MSTQEYNLTGKSQFLLLNPIGSKAPQEAIQMIGVQKVDYPLGLKEIRFFIKKPDT